MAWLTWRQHRPQLLATAGLLLLLALAALLTELPIRSAYHRHALSSCLPPATRSGCEIIVNHFRSEFAARVAVTRYLVVLPALAGLFIGAPLLAREFEYGTFRLAWTQSLSRRRWVLSRTMLLAIAMVAAAALVSALTTWWRTPFDEIGGRIGPDVRHRGPGRARLRVLRARHRRPGGHAAPPHDRGDVARDRRLRRRPRRSREARAAALPPASAPHCRQRRAEHRLARLDTREPPRRRGRPADLDRARGSRDRARATREGRPPRTTCCRSAGAGPSPTSRTTASGRSR